MIPYATSRSEGIGTGLIGTVALSVVVSPNLASVTAIVRVARNGRTRVAT